MMLLRSGYIQALIEHEECIGQFYALFAQKFPVHSDFWGHFEREEKAHAEVLRQLNRRIQSLATAGPFQLKQVREAIEWIRAQMENLQARGLSEKQAFKLALKVEYSLIEREFFAIFPEDGDDTRHEFEALRTHTIQHIARLKQAAQSAAPQ